MQLSLTLRHRLPKVAALFLDGNVSYGVVSAIAWQTDLVIDDQAAALIDTALAQRATRWGRLRITSWPRPSTSGSTFMTPARCGASAPEPAAETSLWATATTSPTPHRCGAGCMPPTPRCWIAG